MAEEESKPAFKTRRITQACDYCHRRSKRCKPNSDSNDRRCQNCVDFRQPCTYDRPVKRRGVKATHSRIEHADKPMSDVHVPSIRTGYQSQSGIQQSVISGTCTLTSQSLKLPENAPWTAPHVAPQAMIVDLIEIYFEVVYPIFPFFHRPTYSRRISRGEYASDRGFFATTMAACALASARVRDGAVYSPRWDVAQLQQPPSEVFFAVAEQAIPPDYTSIYSNHNILRTYALLAVCSIQNGRIRHLQQYLGIFFTLCDIGGLHDESNWPKNVGFVELEERRRVIWSMYTLNVYTSVIWAGIMRVREGQADVAYPTEVDDEMFDDNGIKPTEPTSATVSRQGSPTSANAPATKENCWISGWNFTTDLYRILEHACNNFRSRRSRQHHETFLCDIFGDVNASQASVLQSINTMYANLPPRFKHTNPINLDTTEDRFGFQAANITATMQLLRMVLFAVGGGTLDQKCQIASDVINSFLNIPIAYLRAISTPLLHHLAGIGQILGSVFEEPLCERDYMQVRTVLLSMAQLLANLDVGLSPDERASEKVRAQVARIDDYMATLRHHDHSIRELRRQQFRTTGSGSSGTGPIGKPSSRYPSISMENDKPNAGIHITSSSQYDKPPTTDSQPDSSNYHPNHPVPSSMTPSSGRGSKLPSLSSTLNNNNNNHHSNVSTGPLTDSPMTNIPHQLPPELFEDWPWCFAPTMDFAFPGSGGVSIGGLITGDGGIGSGTGTDTTRGEGGTSSLTSISFTGQGGLQGGIINGYGHGFQMMGGGHIP